jgi:acyl carrier protein
MTARETALDAIQANYGVDAETDALDNYGDSFSRVCLIVDLEADLGVDISDAVGLEWVTVGDVVRWAEDAVRRKPA